MYRAYSCDKRLGTYRVPQRSRVLRLMRWCTANGVAAAVPPQATISRQYRESHVPSALLTGQRRNCGLGRFDVFGNHPHRH